VGLFASPLTAYKLFNGERCLDGNLVTPPPSHVRYVSYIGRLVAKEQPHSHAVRITALKMTTVPRMDRSKLSCQPYIEVIVNSDKVYTSVSKEDLSGLKEFAADGKVELAVDATVKGNVLVRVHHVKTINNETNTMSGGKMFQFQFHTGFVSPECTELVFSRSELDGSVSNEDRFPPPFFVGLSVKVMEEGCPVSPSPSWQNLPHPRTTPRICFVNKQEELMVLEGYRQYDKRAVLHTTEGQEEKMDQYHRVYPANTLSHPQTHPQPQSHTVPHLQTQPTSESASNFFSQLNWRADEQGYSPYISQEEESSSSSSEDEMTAPSELGQEWCKSNRSDGDLTTTANLLNLQDIPNSTPSPDFNSNSNLNLETTEIVTNEGFVETGDLIGLVSSPPPSVPMQQGHSPTSFDPFASTSTTVDKDMYNLFASVPLQPQQITTANPTSNHAHLGKPSQLDEVTFANPMAFTDPPTTCKDPFAGLTSLTTSPTCPPTTGPTPPPTTGPTRPPTTGPSVGSRPPSDGQGKTKFESVIGRRDDRGARNTYYGPRPVVNDGTFRDLLGEEGFGSDKKQPRTLKEMKLSQDIEGALDPESARIKAWAESNEYNVRGLLCSLHTVLWEEEERWRPIDKGQLMHQDQVKKFFRKACLSVHPDKTTGGPHETLARAIFVELNEAYARFEKNGFVLRDLC
jgi:cyclin G-associated kinase